MAETQWITSYGQPNEGPNNGWYNIDNITAIGADNYGTGQWAVDIYVTASGLSGAQHLYVYDTQAEAQAKAVELVNETGRVVT